MAAEPGRPGQPRPPTNAATPGAQEACPPADHVRQHDGPLRVTGVGVSVLYNPRQLNISWANGSDLTLRFDTIKSTVTVDLAPDEGLVPLRFGVRMGIQAARDGMTGVNVVLPFPETISAEVEGLGRRGCARWRPYMVMPGRDRSPVILRRTPRPRPAGPLR